MNHGATTSPFRCHLSVAQYDPQTYKIEDEGKQKPKGVAEKPKKAQR